MTFEYFGGGIGPLGGPVVHGCGGDQCQVGGRGPLPKDDRRVDIVALELGLGIQIEHLDHLSTAEGEDVGGGVHDGCLGLDGAAGDLCLVLEVDEGDLGGFDGDDPFVGFHGGEAMFDGGFWDSQLLQLEYWYIGWREFIYFDGGRKDWVSNEQGNNDELIMT